MTTVKLLYPYPTFQNTFTLEPVTRIDEQLQKKLHILTRLDYHLPRLQDYKENEHVFIVTWNPATDENKSARQKAKELVDAAQQTGGVWKFVWGDYEYLVGVRKIMVSETAGNKNEALVTIELVEGSAV